MWGGKNAEHINTPHNHNFKTLIQIEKLKNVLYLQMFFGGVHKEPFVF